LAESPFRICYTIRVLEFFHAPKVHLRTEAGRPPESRWNENQIPRSIVRNLTTGFDQTDKYQWIGDHRAAMNRFTHFHGISISKATRHAIFPIRRNGRLLDRRCFSCDIRRPLPAGSGA
jgi:hypothetical protein